MRSVTSYLLLLAGSFLVHSSFAAAGDETMRTLRASLDLNPESPADDFAVNPSVMAGTAVANKTKYSNFIVGLVCPGERQPFCAGTYIGYNLVLTAGRCVQPYRCQGFSVEGNRYNWSDSTEQGIKMKVTSIRVHSRYSEDPMRNDIAILKVSGGPRLTSYPEIDAGSFSNIAVHKNFKIIGWGETNWPRYPDRVLREATVTQISLTECRRLLWDEQLPQIGWYYIQPYMICTYGTRTEACLGDQGGPLFVDNPVPAVVGIISDGDCNHAYPGVHTRVSSFAGFFNMMGGCKSGTRFTGGKCV